MQWSKVGKSGTLPYETMLLGQHEALLGEKGRVSLPSRLRESLGNRLIVTFGYEKSLIIVSEENWKALLEGTEDKPFIQQEARETQRFLLGGASMVELDSKGRFVIPSYLRSFAGITSEVIFLGLSRYVELWDKKAWVTYSTHLENNIDTIAKKLLESGNMGK